MHLTFALFYITVGREKYGLLRHILITGNRMRIPSARYDVLTHNYHRRFDEKQMCVDFLWIFNVIWFNAN